MKKTWLLAMMMLCVGFGLHAQRSRPFVFATKEQGTVAFSDAHIFTDNNDDWLVQKAAGLLQTDIAVVSGHKAKIIHTTSGFTGKLIIIGTLKGSPMIRGLAATGKLNLRDLEEKWEGFHIQTIADPYPGISHALVIVGSDKRGAAYGVFELSEQLGVSPWYWWADVPVKKKKQWYVAQGFQSSDAPAVKYRGIFINDEAPAFSGWTKEKFGGVNSRMYEHMFELILRLRGNYLWPAMWGNAFNDDDTLNPVLADKYGIVMGTSHHEPMLRAQQEWKRYGKGEWNYQTNDAALRAFWKKGIENMGTHESIVTVGMRGDGDMPMTEGSNIALLEKIVADQRRILEEVTGKPASETPQLWALYKEVQDYYDKGMRVPDDVTLLLCDDNWGNIRRLPKRTDAPRKGGYGIYYHFDYVGGPRNYKWVNTNPIARTWEQMHLAWEYGVKNIWIVNVGDLKPMEFPISFFLDYAWAPDRIGAADLQRYTEEWSKKQFGPKYASDIAAIISKYTKYNGRRKPELLDANTYSLHNYKEAETVTCEYHLLAQRAEKIYNNIPNEYKDAYYQLVLHPVKACANLQELYFNVAMNRWLASQGTKDANFYADKAKEFYLKDSLITLEYHQIANGKWNHMMSQTHIGYTYWQQPPVQKMPAVTYVTEDKPGRAERPAESKSTIATAPIEKGVNRYVQKDGYVSIDADQYTQAVDAGGVQWTVLPDHGRTGSAITTLPVTADAQALSPTSPYLSYEIYLYEGADSATLMAHFSPTLNFHNEPEGLQYAISIDDEDPQVISINKEDNNPRYWNGWAANNIIIKSTKHTLRSAGKHIVKFWRISPGVVLQKLVLDTGGLKPSYLGPPTTRVNN